MGNIKIAVELPLIIFEVYYDEYEYSSTSVFKGTYI